MDLPFFVAFTVILLLARYVPFALPPMGRAVLADNVAEPLRAAKCAVSVAVSGLVLLVVPLQCAGAGELQQCPEVRVERRALWLNCAAFFLGMVAGGVAVVLPPFAAAPPFVHVAVEHLASFTETIAVTAFAHDLRIFLKIATLKQ
ncbi:hypothetical protein GUJ93_ZPchr0010g9668 [Zizania palustris]|uniref:Uncharacterized protein n=1 Tax=Zizania palustris TaxID=103762 RepID=A0A8J6BMH8_ZIZPA|nr:hypothetical protein GUJ93_ZPchr0010g9668 [Zizania palustris]